MISYFFIWVRITFCRFRYDLLISFSWKLLLPRALTLLAIRVLLYLLCW
jgi:NADH:ubiquinone oxidoreductase subunit H